MKFTDGLWVVKEGYQLEYPKEISDISYSESGITLFAPYTEQEKSSDCIGCGSCEKRCPFEVPIRENMKAAKTVFGY